MSKQAKKSKKNIERIYTVREGRRKYIQEVCDDAKATLEDLEECTQVKLKQLKLRIKEELDSLKHLDDNILESIDDDNEVLGEIKRSGEIRDDVVGVLLQIDEKLPNASNTGAERTTSEKREVTSSAASKLPKLKLKTFNGEVTQWQTFWDSYKSAIHGEKGLDAITKFSYLRDLLEGSAAAAIAGLQTTEANYDAAIQLLQRRFGDSQVIISGHHEALLKIAPLHSSRDVKELRSLYDKVEVHVRGLQSLNVPTSAYGSLLIPVLLGKIPEDVRLLIGRQVKSGQWELSYLLDLLRDEVENRERCSGIQASLPQSFAASKGSQNQRPTPPTASALFTEGRKVTEPTQGPTCTYCKQGHASSYCRVVTDKKARKNILKQQGRCFICLRKNHMARNCASKGKCFNCTGRHHISICEGRNTRPQSDQRPVGQSETTSPTVSSEENRT